MDAEILLVDDESLARKIVRKQLKTIGIESIIEAKNGREALNKLRGGKDSIKLIILDIMMPVMDGHEFMKRAREEGYMAPVIITTSIEQDKIKDLDVYDTYNKPINFDKFSESVKSELCLGRNRTEVIHKIRGLSEKIEQTMHISATRS